MTYAISTVGGDHLGFVLLDGDSRQGQCLVRSLPAEPENFDIPESEYLYTLQTLGELQWQRVGDAFVIRDAQGDVVLTEKEGLMRGAGFVYLVESVS